MRETKTTRKTRNLNQKKWKGSLELAKGRKCQQETLRIGYVDQREHDFILDNICFPSLLVESTSGEIEPNLATCESDDATTWNIAMNPGDVSVSDVIYSMGLSPSFARIIKTSEPSHNEVKVTLNKPDAFFPLRLCSLPVKPAFSDAAGAYRIIKESHTTLDLKQIKGSGNISNIQLINIRSGWLSHPAMWANYIDMFIGAETFSHDHRFQQYFDRDNYILGMFINPHGILSSRDARKHIAGCLKDGGRFGSAVDIRYDRMVKRSARAVGKSIGVNVKPIRYSSHNWKQSDVVIMPVFLGSYWQRLRDYFGGRFNFFSYDMPDLFADYKTEHDLEKLRAVGKSAYDEIQKSLYFIPIDDAKESIFSSLEIKIEAEISTFMRFFKQLHECKLCSC